MTAPNASVLLSRRDVAFLLHEWLDVERLTERPRFAEHSRQVFDEVLALSEQVAAEHFATHNKISDANEPTFDGTTVTVIPQVARALQVFSRTGLLGSSMDDSVGGMQLPSVVTTACHAWFQAANVATMSYPLLTIGNANLLLAHGTAQQIETYVLPMLEGRFFGTMCLSEPHAGSSLADVKTRAELQPDGTYRLFGNKMWISGGDHELTENIVHLVLARTEGAPAGTKGISLFIVPKHLVRADGSLGERNDVALAGLNHKMGYRGTTNALLNFGEGLHTPAGRAGAIGQLVGEEKRGLAYMFHMMNEARVSVGAGAAALGYTGYLKSLRYAMERPQGRPVAAKDPRSPQVPIVQHADVRRMLLAQKSYVEGAMALVLYCAKLTDEAMTAESEQERQEAALLLDTLTPIAKSWPSQWCTAANDLAIQVHGGYGYSREYDVEQHYRDNRLNMIHEGTHGVQGLDLLGRKVVVQSGAGLAQLHTAMAATAARCPEDLAPYGRQLHARAEQLVDVTTRIWGELDEAGVDGVLANASLYLEAVGHVVVAWLWLEQLLAADGKVGEFYDGKRAAGQYFFTYELPKTATQFDLLLRLDRTALDLDPACL